MRIGTIIDHVPHWTDTTPLELDEGRKLYAEWAQSAYKELLRFKKIWAERFGNPDEERWDEMGWFELGEYARQKGEILKQAQSFLIPKPELSH